MRTLLIILLLFPLLVLTRCSGDKSSAVKEEEHPTHAVYTCPMHPQIIRDEPGNCPICGMTLVKKEQDGERSGDTDLTALLKPTNEFVISSIPVTAIRRGVEHIEIETLGTIAYDTRQVGSISSRVSGRIEKLYIKYRYQKVTRGQKILEIYSPEILTAEQNLLFLLKNDAQNITFIRAAKERLLLLGMSSSQLNQVINSGKPSLTVSVYSNYSGHIHDAASKANMNSATGGMTDIALLTEELNLKEGMYVQKGQSVFTVFDPDRAWAILSIYGENQALVKQGYHVKVTPETAPSKSFKAVIDFIEPFYRKEDKTLTARVYFNNSQLQIPIGSQVRAVIYGNTIDAYWLPKESAVSLGMEKIVFEKTDGGFKARKIKAGVSVGNQIQILSGLSERDSVAVNAQYLMDSESFIKIKN